MIIIPQLGTLLERILQFSVSSHLTILFFAVVLINGPEERTIPGNALSVHPDLPFRGLEVRSMNTAIIISWQMGISTDIDIPT